MIERAVVADLRRLADHDPHPVVDEHPPADRGARMDLDPGEPAAPVGEPAGKPPESRAPQRVGDVPVPDQRMQARVASEHFPGGCALRGRGRKRRRCLLADERTCPHSPISDCFAQLLRAGGSPRELLNSPRYKTTPGAPQRDRGVHIPEESMRLHRRRRCDRAIAATPRRRAGDHAQGPPFLAARRHAAIDAAGALVRQDREGLEQSAEVPDLSRDAARRHAAAADRPGEGRRGRHRVDAARLHGGPLPDDGSVRAAVHVGVGGSDVAGRVGLLRDSSGTRSSRASRRSRVNVHDNGYVHGSNKQVKMHGRLQGHEDARADAADEQDARGTWRNAGRDAAAGARGRALERRRRRLPAAVGSDPVDQGARALEVPQRDRSQVARAVHRGVHPRDEPGEVRQPAARPEEGDRRELGRARRPVRSASSGTRPRRRRASRPPIAATRST